MADFKAGPLALVLLVYFFLFFSIIYFTTQVSINNPDYGIDVSGLSVTDPGFQTQFDPFTDGFCEGSLPLSSAFCGWQDNLNSNETCEYVPGCEWKYNVLALDYECSGLILISEHDSGTSCGADEVVNNETLCRLIGCTWSDYQDGEGSSGYTPTTSAVTSPFKTTISVMTGFDAEIGIPSIIRWVFSFFFFWIPFLIMLWSAFMSIPWLN